MRIALISDIHLSAQRPYFHFNWEILLEKLQDEAPELVLISGDLALDGAHHADDLVFARAQLDRLPCPWRAVPGNHDVGNNHPDVRGEAVVTQPRLDAWRASFGPDWWAMNAGPWRIIGLNSLILGSGLPAEAEQERFLAAEIAAAAAPVVLMYHKPLCNAGPAEDGMNQSYWYPAARELLRPHLEAGRVAMALSGHLHESRQRVIGGVPHIWAPGVAFVADMAEEVRAARGGRRRVGYAMLDTARPNEAEVREPPEMMNVDIGTWLTHGIGHYATFAGQRPFLGLQARAAE